MVNLALVISFCALTTQAYHQVRDQREHSVLFSQPQSNHYLSSPPSPNCPQPDLCQWTSQPFDL
jgi:hypothetical protein